MYTAPDDRGLWPDALNYYESAIPALIFNPIGGRVTLYGFSLRESTGAATATMTLINGGNANGLEVVGINLAPNESTREWFGPNGILFEIGLFPNLVAGTIAGALWIGRRQPMGQGSGS